MRIDYRDGIRFIFTTGGKRFIVEGATIRITAAHPFPTAEAYLRLWERVMFSERERSAILRATLESALRAINHREYSDRDGKPLDAEYLAFGWRARW